MAASTNLSPNILSSLGVFDAVARLGSFSAAGEALNITQSAVSHRIKQLEANLGMALLRRTTRKVELTNEGARFARAAAAALSEVGTALQDMKRDESDGSLTVSVLASLAMKWMVPHLNDFHRQQPAHQVSILALDEVSDLHHDPVDAAIRFGRVPTPGLHATPLCGDWLVPVASPALVAAVDARIAPRDLSKYPLLKDTRAGEGAGGYSWSLYFQAVGVDDAPTVEGQSFNRADLTLQAAIGGQGIALGRAMLIEQDWLESNLLVQVGRAIPSPAKYSFLTLAEKADWPKIVAFRTWLKQSMQESFTAASELLNQYN